jgi:hypothetical protein
MAGMKKLGFFDMGSSRSLDWEQVGRHVASGTLDMFLDTISQANWYIHDEYGASLLHVACYGNNSRAIIKLAAYGLDINEIRPTANSHDYIFTPAGLCILYNNCFSLRILCKLGANLHAEMLAECISRQRYACAKILIAHGMRLSKLQNYVAPNFLKQYEERVVRCRAVVLTLLGIKRRRVPQLAHVDKFLIRFLALEIWSARGN